MRMLRLEQEPFADPGKLAPLLPVTLREAHMHLSDKA